MKVAKRINDWILIAAIAALCTAPLWLPWVVRP